MAHITHAHALLLLQQIYLLYKKSKKNSKKICLLKKKHYLCTCNQFSKRLQCSLIYLSQKNINKHKQLTKTTKLWKFTF